MFFFCKVHDRRGGGGVLSQPIDSFSFIACSDFSRTQ